MTKSVPFAKKDIIEAIKEAGLITGRQLSDELAEFYQGFLKPEFKNVNVKLDKVEVGLNKVETEMGFVKDELKGLSAELSATPSREEFNKLKSKIDRFHLIS